MDRALEQAGSSLDARPHENSKYQIMPKMFLPIRSVYKRLSLLITALNYLDFWCEWVCGASVTKLKFSERISCFLDGFLTMQGICMTSILNFLPVVQLRI